MKDEVPGAGCLVPGAARRTKHQAPNTDILAAFAADFTPLAEALATLLQDPSKEAAEKLLNDLPTLLPDDPATAAIIAEEMAKAFGQVKVEGEGEGKGEEITQEMAEKIYEEMMSK